MLQITVRYITVLGDLHDIEMFLYQDGEKMTLYPKDDDHADLLIDGFVRGCYNKFEINDERGTR